MVTPSVLFVGASTNNLIVCLSLIHTASTFIEQRVTILKSVRFVRCASIIANILETLCLGAFSMSYNVEMIYYLPTLYSISCTIMTMTFIRNRQYFVQRQYCRSCKCCVHHETALLAEIIAGDEHKNNKSTPKMKRRATSGGAHAMDRVPPPIMIKRSATLPIDFEEENRPHSGCSGATTAATGSESVSFKVHIF